MTNQTSNLQLLGREHLKGCIEPHLQVSMVILFKDLNEALLEHRRSEAVGQDHVAAGRIGQ